MSARLSSLVLPAACLACATMACTSLDPRSENVAFVSLTLAWGLLACGAAWAHRGAAVVPRVVWGTAMLLRVVALTLPLTLSDDVYRYLWEGRVQLAGLDPFLHPPSDAALEALRDGTWALVNHKDVSTIYPPLALLSFRGVAAMAYTPLAWKVLTAVADLALLGLLARVVRGRGGRAWAATAYALHPLPVLESAGSGHLEPLALLALVAALWAWDSGRAAAAATATIVGAGVKLLPAVALLPMLRTRLRASARGLLVGGALLALASLPFLDAGVAILRGFDTYYDAWAFNAALFPLLEHATGDPGVARAAGVALGAVACACALVRLRDPARLALFTAAALLLLSPVVHPWYVLWALVPALCVGAWPWLVLATTAPLAYLVLGTLDPVTGAWDEAEWVRWLEYPPLLLAGLVWWARRTRPWRSPALDQALPSSSSPTAPAAST